MKRSLTRLLRHPRSGRPLRLAVFQAGPDALGEESITEGVLFDEESGDAYPILNGVPVMLDSRFPREFLERHATSLAGVEGSSGLRLGMDASEGYSFSKEWDHFFEAEAGRTWGWSAEERVEQLLLETQVDREWCKGKLILDAGCGNGALSEAVSRLGADVVALDFSTSVLRAERHRASRVSFVQGDLQSQVFCQDAFDLAFSIGVLHHTRSTFETFVQVAKFVKPDGLFYVWLYRRPEEFLRRYLKVPLFDLARAVISRLPSGSQSLAVSSYARLWKAAHRLASGGKDIPLSEYLVSAYDDLTPQWRHYHTPSEVSGWFHKCGFSAPSLTHWDNPYGFGLVARKTEQEATPGIHYGNSPKLWDDRHTILG